jgi:hypothetical protein
LNITLTGSSAFSITGDTCSATSLGPKKSCTVTIQYAPTTAAENDTATLTAASNKPTARAAETLAGSSDTYLCHATLAEPPYEQLWYDPISPDPDFLNTHLADTGPVWFPGIPLEPGWGDIIPPTQFQGNTVSLNWNAAGQAIWNNDCAVPQP